jgi:hypothetical protein
MSFHSREVQYVVIPPRELLKVFKAVHGDRPLWQVYLTVTKKKRCWETRGLPAKDMVDVVNERFLEKGRNLTEWLNNWSMFAKLNRQIQASAS